MKKYLSFLLALVLILALGIPAFADGVPTITSREMLFYLCDINDTRIMPVYFMDESDVPYLTLEDWAELMTYLMRNYVKKNQGISFDLAFSMNGDVGTLTRTDGAPYTMVVNCDADTISFVDYDAFIRPDNDRVLVDLLEAGESAKLFHRTEKSYERYGDEITVDFGAYGIDLVSDGLNCYVPVQTLSDFLLSQKYVNVYYNGKAIFFAKNDAFIDEEEDDGHSDLGKLYYAVEPGKQSESMATFNYAELCAAFDSLYGLKDIHGIVSFDDLATRAGCKQALLSTDPSDVDTALYAVITKHLDDQHSIFNAASPFSREGLMEKMQEQIGGGQSQTAFMTQYSKYLMSRMASYPEGAPIYEEIGNTAYITFDSFQALPEDVDYYAVAPTAEVTDTIGVMLYAYSQIMRENSPVENVVLDLSLNVGGDADAAIFTISTFLGEGYGSVIDTFSGALATGIYQVDVNLDKQFDENDRGLTDKKLYCLISPCSFSCGNFVPNVFKNSNQVTLLGKTSGGGSCIVLPMSTAYGTYFQLSGPQRMSFVKNGSFYDIDRGAVPDYTISDPAFLYDRVALTDYINSIH